MCSLPIILPITKFFSGKRTMLKSKLFIKHFLGLIANFIEDLVEKTAPQQQPRNKDPRLASSSWGFFGQGDGRWKVCYDDLSKDSIIYSVGIGYDTSFDEELIKSFGCKVQAFDPTL